MVLVETKQTQWRLHASPTLITVECDFSSIRPVDLIAVPSVRIFKAIATVLLGVRNLAIGVPTSAFIKTFVTRSTAVALDDCAVF